MFPPPYLLPSLPPLLLLEALMIHFLFTHAAAVGGDPFLVARRLTKLGPALFAGSLLLVAAIPTPRAFSFLGIDTVSRGTITTATPTRRARRIRQFLLRAPPRSSSDASTLGLPSSVDTSTM